MSELVFKERTKIICAARICDEGVPVLRGMYLAESYRGQGMLDHDLADQEVAALTPQFAASKTGRGGRKVPPLAFTEHGVTMLSSILNSERAIEVNIAIVCAFGS